jgi:hypothetical protein
MLFFDDLTTTMMIMTAMTKKKKALEKIEALLYLFYPHLSGENIWLEKSAAHIHTMSLIDLFTDPGL